LMNGEKDILRSARRWKTERGSALITNFGYSNITENHGFLAL
jgi:hypothetical protein